MTKSANSGLNIPEAQLGRVVVIGGGFGGIALIKSLLGSGLQVVLLDVNNYHQFQPLLYQVATSGLEPTAISFPLRSILRQEHGVRDWHFRMTSVESLDLDSHTVRTAIGELKYDYLVIAAGATTNFFGIKGVEQSAMPLKSVGDALALRNQIYRTLEQAIDTEDPHEREVYLNFVIVGGGPTGVELAGAVAELRNRILPKDYPQIDFSQMKVILMNASDRLLEAFSAQSSTRTLQDLQAMGVDVMLNCRVHDYIDDTILYNESERLMTKNMVWASGITANRIEGIPASSVGRGGRIMIDNFCQIITADDNSQYSNVYAIGDIAAMQPTAHPQVAQVAIQQGKLVGQNIVRLIRNQEPQPFTYHDKGSMATIGRNRAVAEVSGFHLSGFLAWVMWLFIHLLFIVGVRNKFTVVIDWAWSYITRDQPLRSIIEASRKN